MEHRKRAVTRMLVVFVLMLSLFKAAAAGRGLIIREKDNLHGHFHYNSTLAKILVEYAAVAYVNDADALISWTCSRCNGLTKGFKLVQLIIDLQHCLQAFVGIAEDLHSVVIAFRGTQENSIQNWVEDLYFKQLDFNYPGVTGAMVHHGFFSAYYNTSLGSNVVEAVNSIRKERNDLNTIVTGHSMGGAMATFCALDLTVNQAIPNIQAVTFGQPRIGNSVFAAYYSIHVPETYRITHANDIVPHVPPYYSFFPKWSYHHFSREIWVYQLGLGSLSYEVERVCDKSGEDPNCSRSVSGNSIADHLCYFGVYLQADNWASCGFVIHSNVSYTLPHATNGKLVLINSTQSNQRIVQESRSWQVS